jgi:dTDP-4-dehydrorhamnose reductase
LYGVHGNNFVKTILRLAQEKRELRVVADQHGCPTWTGDLAEAISGFVDRIREDISGIQWGTYHFCGSGSTTWYGFAQAVLAEGRLHETLCADRVRPIETRDYPTPARRPKSSVLDCGKIWKTFDVQSKPWRQSLRAMVDALYNGDAAG